jgi:hypothetical protein
VTSTSFSGITLSLNSSVVCADIAVVPLTDVSNSSAANGITLDDASCIKNMSLIRGASPRTPCARLSIGSSSDLSPLVDAFPTFALLRGQWLFLGDSFMRHTAAGLFESFTRFPFNRNCEPIFHREVTLFFSFHQHATYKTKKLKKTFQPPDKHKQNERGSGGEVALAY